MPSAPLGSTASPDDPDVPAADQHSGAYTPPGEDARSPADTTWAVDELHRLLVASVQDYAIFAVTADGRIASWNPGAQRLKGYAPEEAVRQHLSIFYPPESRRPDGIAPRVLDLLDQAAREGRAEGEAWRVRRDGTRFWANVVLTPIRAEGGTLLGFAKVTRDLTARRAAEERARALAAETAARMAAERDSAEIRTLVDRLQDQAAELEAQSAEAQGLAEELEHANEELQRTAEDAERARDAAERGVARLERLQRIAAALATAVDVDTVVTCAVREARLAGWRRSGLQMQWMKR